MAALQSLFALLNRLLPFATPGTPLLQDLLHLAAICAALYVAPLVQASYADRSGGCSLDDGRANSTAAATATITTTTAQAYTGVEPEPEPELGTEEYNRRAQRREGPDGQNNHYIDDDDGDEGSSRIQVPGADFDTHDNVDDDEVDDDDHDHDHDHDENQNGIGPGAATNHGQAGPPRESAPRAGNIGAKKAKSLARKDQRRAYNEFLRAQGDARRAADAETARERELETAYERARRADAEAVLEARKLKERDERRRHEASIRERDRLRRERVVDLVGEMLRARGMCDLCAVARELNGSGKGKGKGKGNGNGKANAKGKDRGAEQMENDIDPDWVADVVRAAGMVDGSGKGKGRTGEQTRKGLTIITSEKWIVRVTEDDMRTLYDDIMSDGMHSVVDGAVSFDMLAQRLEKILRAKTMA